MPAVWQTALLNWMKGSGERLDPGDGQRSPRSGPRPTQVRLLSDNGRQECQVPCMPERYTDKEPRGDKGASVGKERTMWHKRREKTAVGKV